MENKSLSDGNVAPFSGIDADIPAYVPRVSGRTFIMWQGVLTASRVLTISTKNAFPGDVFEVIDKDASLNTLTVVAGLETYSLRAFEGFRYHVKYIFTGVFWAVLDDTVMPRNVRRVAPSDADHDLTIQDGNFFVATSVAGSAKNWRFTNAGALQGQVIDVFNSTSGFAINVKNHASATIAICKSGAGASRSARIMFDADGTGDWVCIDQADSA